MQPANHMGQHSHHSVGFLLAQPFLTELLGEEAAEGYMRAVLHYEVAFALVFEEVHEVGHFVHVAQRQENLSCVRARGWGGGRGGGRWPHHRWEIALNAKAARLGLVLDNQPVDGTSEHVLHQVFAPADLLILGHSRRAETLGLKEFVEAR